MCQQVAKGTRWGKCGHFQRHLVVAVMDCCQTNCERSCNHPPRCPLRTCITTYGREIQQDVDLVDEFCFQCRAAQAKAAGIPLR
ncbi:hypothetical protein HYPSUDRAFT_207184 [Hypholoma sublateritium FD-334 SS-4]|uniref:Uncharacterized protein n=1 Tax=Hypholoma sublateritium (strain FD-334 SS-4) TaxID=945553 RepID=A0A0D2KNY3_HYPSF|nr:hypothetical protein HYPSUDRAFT_207184 [Hypholoma sublateritium FD-334 SS-4]